MDIQIFLQKKKVNRTWHIWPPAENKVYKQQLSLEKQQ